MLLGTKWKILALKLHQRHKTQRLKNQVPLVQAVPDTKKLRKKGEQQRG
jgi:hypothetical protein